MVILVTGATGRVGKLLVATLLQRGEELRVIVRKKPSPLLPPEVEQIEHDLSTGAPPVSVFTNVSKIVHLAALIGDYPYNDLLLNNAYATKNLLSACPTKIQRIVIASSISVYGEYKGQIVDESFTPKSESPYGQSKLLAEQFAHGFCPSLSITLLRIGMIYGPGFEEGYYPV